jgi:hypothetical protein
MTSAEVGDDWAKAPKIKAKTKKQETPNFLTFSGILWSPPKKAVDLI